jgi:hypothetical protein
VNEAEALAQFAKISTVSPVETVKSMTESEALAQFITIPDSEKCGKCNNRLTKQIGNVYPDKYFDAPWGKPQMEVCVTCFDNDIKSRMF